MNKAKPFNIPKMHVWNAWLTVKANKGSSGIDGLTIKEFEVNLKQNLYKIWNRLCSGSYMPPGIKRVNIPKDGGKIRPLGIPTISDRIAQTVVKSQLELIVEPIFHPSSFGYRPNKSAHDAVNAAKLNCWKKSWVIDLDIKGFFDNIDHDLLMKAVKHVTDCKWTILYINRWLRADIIMPDGQIIKPIKGTPQGGVISPVLANLFMHYVHDRWIQDTYPAISFERYADDIVLHCSSRSEAKFILKELENRFSVCQLEINPEKTKIVCCNSKFEMRENELYEFDFLGFTFRRRGAKGTNGNIFTGFLPAIRKQAKKSIVAEIRRWKIHRWSSATIDDIAKHVNAKIRGWINYYGKFHKSEMHFLYETMNIRLVKWLMCKHKRYKQKKTRAYLALEEIRKATPQLFAHWSICPKG